MPGMRSQLVTDPELRVTARVSCNSTSDAAVQYTEARNDLLSERGPPGPKI